MKKIGVLCVTAATLMFVAPSAMAGKYSDHIDSCKAAIADKVGGDRVSTSLGDIRRLPGSKVQFEFKVNVTRAGQSTRQEATCITTRSGDVVEVSIS